MRRTRYLLFASLSVGLSAMAFLVLAEVVLRFLPVNEGLRNRPVNADQPIALYEHDEDLLWSRDWDLKLVNRLRVNRQGFVNRYDYDAGSDIPVLAVVGDSMIQASMVPYAETLHGRLEHDARSKLGGRYRVYSFAASGAPLSQYLAYARHAQQNYEVDGMVVVIIANDFDESLPRYRNERRFHQFGRNEDGELELTLPRGYSTHPILRVGRHSALFRYLFLNAQLRRAWGNIRTMMAPEVEYVANTSADMSEQRMTDSKDVVDAFLRQLPEYAGLSPQDIVLVVDASRRELYALDSLDDMEQSYFSVIRRYFMEQADARGYEVLDMAPRFFDEHKRTGVVFEYPTDGHWNSIGHETAYEAVRRSAMHQRLLRKLAVDGS